MLPSFAGCWCGVTPGLFLFGLAPNRRGGVAVTPAAFSGWLTDQAMFQCCEWCGGLPMLTEFQLWVLSSIVMLALLFVGIKLPG